MAKAGGLDGRRRRDMSLQEGADDGREITLDAEPEVTEARQEL
jgi:hypothetical protein